MANLFQKLGATLGGAKKSWDLAAAGHDSIVVEASVLQTLSEEIEGYRKLGGSTSDLTPWNQEKMQKKALALFQKNHMARRLLGIQVDYVVGDGISAQAQHKDDSMQEEIQGLIGEFWNDPLNAMDRKNEARCLDWCLYGELVMPVRRNEQDGRIRLGWIDPCVISNVIPDPLTGEPAVLEVSDSAAGAVGQKTLQVIRFREETERWEGEVFFHTQGNVTNSTRGISDLYSAADWFDVLDQTMKAQADRVKLLSRFIWDVTLEGADDTKIVDWLKKWGKSPPPAAVRAHNEKVTWNAVAPKLNSHEATNNMKLLKTQIMGGYGYPNHWFGSGDDANLATAAAMAEPTRRALARKGKAFKWILTDVIRFALQSRQEIGGAIKGVDLVRETPFNVNIPNIGGDDMGKVGTAITQITNAITACENSGYISHETAGELAAMVLGQTGHEIDPAAERKAIEEDQKGEQAAQRKKDLEAEDELRKASIEVLGGHRDEENVA